MDTGLVNESEEQHVEREAKEKRSTINMQK
jgi:hypothetical protein